MSSKAIATNIKLYVVLQVIILVLYCKICFINGHNQHKWMHYILVWSISPKPSNSFVKNLGRGQDTFIKRKCQFQNCFVSRDETYLKNIHDFDAILFLGSELSNLPVVPNVRYDNQKYVFVSVEPAVGNPVRKEFNAFFNWTWTYKLNSDICSNDVVVRNKHNEVIGPARNMHWIKYNKRKSISQYTKTKLGTKKIAAIWFSSRCSTSSKRENYIKELQKELLFEYKLDLRKCGRCGEYTCVKQKNDYCMSKVESDYYFYLAFENAICEDFVTERVVNALQHYAVPIVYGGANYSRFLPAGSYLDATNVHPDDLAKTIHSIINNTKIYYKFFKWRKYYNFHHKHESPETDDYCAFCALLNLQMNERKVYTNFIRWWTEPSDSPLELFEPEVITKYESMNNTVNNKVKVLVQNPKSLVPPSLNEDSDKENSFITTLGRLFQRYFMSK